MIRTPLFAAASALALTACNATVPGAKADNGETSEQASSDGKPFVQTEIAKFNEPWAMAFMPGTSMAFITEKGGTVKFIDLPSGRVGSIESGLPKVDYGGQGGLGDIAFAPDWPQGKTSGGQIYLSWVETGQGDTRGAAVGRGTLECQQADSCTLTNFQTIWRQNPKVSGRGHYSHRLAFSPDGKYLFITSGERQKMQPAQDPASDLGKIIRLDIASGKAEHWSIGHRNLLGIAFDANGNLWNAEMGPQGGDELNLVLQGKNYGWPKVSNGSHYGGEAIPDHAAGDGFEAPKVWWNPSISPSSLMVYSGNMFPQWKGDAFIGALSGEALIRVDLDGTNAAKGDQWPMGTRIRAVHQGPDGAIWLLEDGPDGRLMKLTSAG